MSDALKLRIRQLAKPQKEGKCVLYVMSRDQRVNDNHALLAAQKHALAKKIPLAVVFCLYEKVGYRAREHFAFMLDGLREVEADLAELNIPFMLLIGEGYERLSGVIHHTAPDAVYFDFSPLISPQTLQKKLAQSALCAMYVVDTHNIVPVWQVSDKQEVAAYTLRPKLHRSLEAYLEEPEPIQKHPYNWPGPIISLARLQDKIEKILESIDSNGTKPNIESGEKAARDALYAFIKTKLERYIEDRNNPSASGQSDLSAYLHFGQISSLRVVLELRGLLLKQDDDLHLLESPKMPQATRGLNDSINGLLEEMIVRKELSDNFCYYNNNYKDLDGAAEWAKKTIDEHRADVREFLYDFSEFELAKTHDPAWNAAQRQLTATGKMHGYMRMYWAKKVLEWTAKPEEALGILVKLNDHYSLDGGDPNGYVGILWSIAGVHDKPWTERKVFGKIRYMNYEGLKRKFDIQVYEKQWS